MAEEERWGQPKPQPIKHGLTYDEDIITWLKAELRKMYTEEVDWIFKDMALWNDGGPGHNSDLLMSDVRIREDDGVLYIQYPDGRMYVADLCTPIHDSLKEEIYE